MIKCDVCNDELAVAEGIYEDIDGNFIILSTCTNLECNTKFVRISNLFILTPVHLE